MKNNEIKNTATTPATPATATTPATPEKVTTIAGKKVLDEKTRANRTTARDASVTALKKLYTENPVALFEKVKFLSDRNETPIATEYTFTAYSIDSNGDVTTDEKRENVRFSLSLFAPSANRKLIRELWETVGRAATATDNEPTTATAKPQMAHIKEIARLCGFGSLVDKINHTTALHVMRDGRTTTGKGNRMFNENVASLSLFGHLYAMQCGKKKDDGTPETVSAYAERLDKRDSDRKARQASKHK